MLLLSKHYFSRSLLPSLPLVIFGVSAFISGLLILMLPETLGKELPANVREALDLSLPAPSERPFGPERLAVPIGMVTTFFFTFLSRHLTLESVQKLGKNIIPY